MNEFEVFYTGEKRSGSVIVQASDNRSARQKAKPKIIDLAGPSAQIGRVVDKGTVIGN